MNVKFRIELEKQIARKLVEDVIKAGFSIDVNDGEEVTVKSSTDIEEVINAMMTTDEDYLILHRGNESGWVRFIYGNDGWDVINDYTTNLDDVLEATNKLVEELEEKYA